MFDRSAEARNIAVQRRLERSAKRSAALAEFAVFADELETEAHETGISAVRQDDREAEDESRWLEMPLNWHPTR